MVIGFSVKASRAVQTLANSSSVPLHLETVIYRLIDTVRAKVAALLPPLIETRVLGEAVVQQVFTISLKGKDTQMVAGCRVGNGVIGRDSKIRVLRGENREVVHEGDYFCIFLLVAVTGLTYGTDLLRPTRLPQAR